MRAFTYIAAVLAIAVTGCAKEPPAQKVVVKGDTYCKIARPIRWSKRDTAESITAMRRENAKYNRVCR